MCGIAGIVGNGVDQQLLTRMAGAIAHRGPDDHGVWIDREAGVGLGHRRLSIVELSPAGHQPMTSGDGAMVLCYNGELYNNAALRDALEEAGGGPAGGWRGHSDTETLVEAAAFWGLEETLSRAVGMFAFALWDKRDRTLRLVRDRFGEKPLYYGWAGGDFLFGSELKALRVHPGFTAEIDRRALHLFAARTYIPAPWSIYRGIFKLEPGCILTITADAAKSPRSEPPQTGSGGAGLNLSRYWSYRDVVAAGLAAPIDHEDEALAALERTLAQAVKDQSFADVPVGAFLSGGIDSSTIVALYQLHSARPVRTFSIGFDEAAFNEAHHARAVAEQLGTIHHEQIVTASDAREVIPLLPGIYDEPFADSSQLPTFLVSRFARGEVTVALTGDGGDELFAGYNRHFLAPKLWSQLSRVPRPLRALAGRTLGRMPAGLWASGASLLGGSGPGLAGKIQKGLRVGSAARAFDDVYSSFLDEWGGERSPVIGGGSGPGQFDMDVGGGAEDTVRMMYCDSVSYLPDDILCKVDRASMAVSLETRVPFLDHRVAEVAARIPLRMKVGRGEGKQILRKLLYSHAPRALFERPKAGFGVPVGEWIKGPLRPWAEELLNERRLESEGWFDTTAIRQRWSDHLRGTRDSTSAIWAVLMFQAWLDERR